jgi:chromosome segregation protein
MAANERVQRAEEARGIIAAEEAQEETRRAERERAKTALAEAVARFERWREKRQALLNENFQLAERIKAAQRGAARAMEQAQSARLRMARVEAQMEAVGQRLQDEYDLHPESAVALTGGVPVDRDTAQEISRLRREIKSLGAVNVGAIEEYERVSERWRFLSEQRADLEEAKARLTAAIAEIDDSTRGVFFETYQAVGVAFSRLFTRLFGGGSTELVLTDPDDILETGIDIVAQPPGKKRQSLALLSGGERALTATALLFAFLEVRPAPFCVLDEVDAPLDGANVEKFADLLREFGQASQFIVITHNATTMEAAPLWYGITMQEPGVSRGLSMKVPQSEPSPVAAGES